MPNLKRVTRKKKFRTGYIEGSTAEELPKIKARTFESLPGSGLQYTVGRKGIPCVARHQPDITPDLTPKSDI